MTKGWFSWTFQKALTLPAPSEDSTPWEYFNTGRRCAFQPYVKEANKTNLWLTAASLPKRMFLSLNTTKTIYIHNPDGFARGQMADAWIHPMATYVCGFICRVPLICGVLCVMGSRKEKGGGLICRRWFWIWTQHLEDLGWKARSCMRNRAIENSPWKAKETTGWVRVVTELRFQSRRSFLKKERWCLGRTKGKSRVPPCGDREPLAGIWQWLLFSAAPPLPIVDD